MRSLAYRWVIRLAAAAALATAAACTAPPAPSPDELLEADRAFAADTAARGLDGWMGWFAEDAVRLELHGALVRGRDAIREHDRELQENPDLSLRWEPTDAVLFATGDHGVTRGRYELVAEGGEGERVLLTGSYVTVWRRDRGGWRAILDTGAPDPPE
jgi:ketosteroid isomerase-like protein